MTLKLNALTSHNYIVVTMHSVIFKCEVKGYVYVVIVYYLINV